jgi:hypothetical protein
MSISKFINFNLSWSTFGWNSRALEHHLSILIFGLSLEHKFMLGDFFIYSILILIQEIRIKCGGIRCDSFLMSELLMS